MHIKLFAKIKSNATIICGFPGFGLIGTIATQFLIEHLHAIEVGIFHYEEVPPTLAIHQGKIVKPMAIYYDKKHNVVLIHVMIGTKGIEWKLSDAISKFSKEINAKQVINLEGVPSPKAQKSMELFYIGDHKLTDFGVKPLKESIIIGVVAGLFLRIKNLTSLFVSTQSKLPDSKASAKVIEILDKYLNLDVDYKPLLKQAEVFEAKLKKIIERSNNALQSAKKKELSYVG